MKSSADKLNYAAAWSCNIGVCVGQQICGQHGTNNDKLLLGMLRRCR